MIFVGDIAYPGTIEYNFDDCRYVFDSDDVVANLEGAITADENNYIGKNVAFNSISVLDYLKQANVKVVSLANNHITDISRSPSRTKKILEENNIVACGAGDTIQEAAAPAEYDTRGTKIYFLAFGWQVIQCITADSSQPGVNPLDPAHVLQSIKKLRAREHNSRIIIAMHWGYELELYPLPMHRQLAFAAIDSGADAIIGCHSHRVQGIEFYKDAPVVYGLGNWFFPHGCFGNGKVSFPDYTRLQLALQWNMHNGEMVCHWFEYVKDKIFKPVHLASEPVSESQRVKELTPFAGMEHEQYIRWFSGNRKKKVMLPVYKNYRDTFINGLYDKWMRIRDTIIRLLVRLNIK